MRCKNKRQHENVQKVKARRLEVGSKTEMPVLLGCARGALNARYTKQQEARGTR